MSALGKLFRATAFKLSLVYLVVFTIFFLWFFPKVVRGLRRIFRAAAAFLRGEKVGAG